MTLSPEQIRDRGELLRLLAAAINDCFKTPFLPNGMVQAILSGDQTGIRIYIGDREVHINVQGEVIGAGTVMQPAGHRKKPVPLGWRHFKPVPLDDKKPTLSMTLLKEISVPAGPDTNDEIDMAIYHDPVSNAVIGLDASFIERFDEDEPIQFPSPYHTSGPLVDVMIVPPAGRETKAQKEKNRG